MALIKGEYKHCEGKEGHRRRERNNSSDPRILCPIGRCITKCLCRMGVLESLRAVRSARSLLQLGKLDC